MASKMDAQQVLTCMSDIDTEAESKEERYSQSENDVSDSANSEDSVVEESENGSESDSGMTQSRSSDED